MSSFTDPDAVSRYAEGPVKLVPGFLALQTMARLLLAEHARPDGQILVLGAGGGLELRAFATAEPGWRFCGIDPSAPMLDLARRTLGDLSPRAALHQGYIDTAPPGPFDAATCLLTLHFLPAPERLQTLIHLYDRLKPGAPLVVAHHSFPQDATKPQWLSRFAAFAAANGMPDMQNPATLAAMGDRLPTLSPEQDQALLHQAGFTNITLFYAAFTFRGWVAYRPTS
jgi:tRNA (cmo5U34)-methyltransferase